MLSPAVISECLEPRTLLTTMPLAEPNDSFFCAVPTELTPPLPDPELFDPPSLDAPDVGPSLNDPLSTDPESDDFENAASLLLSPSGAGIVDGDIEAVGNRDLYRVEATRNGLQRIRQSAASGSSLDTLLRVFNSNGRIIAQNDDGGGVGRNSLVQFPASTGTVFFVEAGAFADSTGTYRVEIDVANAVMDDFGNGITDAAELSIGPLGLAQRLAAIEFSGDRDVFRLTASEDGLLSIRQRAVPGSFLDTFLRVRDENGDELASNDDDGTSRNSLVQIPVLQNQTLFIEAGAFGTSRGPYAVIVSAGVPVSDDAGDTVATAVTLDVDLSRRAMQRGRIDRPGDRDVFRLLPTESGQLTIRQSAEPGIPLDTLLRVLNSNGEQLAANDDDAFSLNSRISVPVAAGEAVFIEAGGFGQGVGDYVLLVEREVEAVDDFGNNIASADVAGGVELRGEIEASGDVDVFQVQVQETGLLTIRQRATRGNSVDCFLRILDSSGAELAVNDNDRFSLNSVATVSVTAGDTIYVEAGAFSTSVGRYVVTLSAGVDDLNGRLDNTAPAIAISAAGNGIQQGVINFDTDVDVFRFSPDRDGAVTVNLSATSDESLDTFLEILSSGEELVVVDDDGGDALNSHATFDVKAGETYFVRASSFGETTGQYQLSLSSTFEVDDVGNTFSAARSVVLDASGTGRSSFALDGPTDVDLFEFVAIESGDATLQINQENGVVPGRVFVFKEIDDASDSERNRVRVARDRDRDGLVTFSIEEGTTYFVEVAGGTGDVELTLSTDTSVEDESKIDDDVASDAADLFRLGLASILVGAADESSLDTFTATLEQTAAFLRDKIGTDEPVLILGLDPVDYIVTDTSGRQAGYTATDGEINEFGSSVFNSGDGVAELLVIVNPSANVFQLDLVGVGTDFNGGAAYIDSDGIQTTSFEGTLDKDNLEVALDFSNTAAFPLVNGATAETVNFFASVGDNVPSRLSDGSSLDAILDSVLSLFDQSVRDESVELEDSWDDLIGPLLSWLAGTSSEEQDADLVDRVWLHLRESILEISSGALDLMLDILQQVDQELP